MHTYAGIVVTYCFGQLSLWALLHATFLFWALNFPFSYRQLRVSGRIHRAHVISVLLGLILPLPGPLINLKEGYTYNFFFHYCISHNIYYTLLLPLSIISGAALTLLMFAFRTLFIKVGTR